MKSFQLNIVQKFNSSKISGWPKVIATSPSESIIVLDSSDHSKNIYSLYSGELKESSYGGELSFDSGDLLFKSDHQLGVAHKDQTLSFHSPKGDSVSINITASNSQTARKDKSLFEKARSFVREKSNLTPKINEDSLKYENSSFIDVGSSDSLLHPVTLFFNGVSGQAFYFTLLKISFEDNTASCGRILSCSHSDFPMTDERLISNDNPPQIESMGYRKGKLLASIVGSSNPKYGAHYYDLVVLDSNGRVTKTLYTEGAPSLNSSKKFGRSSRFTSDMEYCVITPMYQTDSWKGQPRLFDLKSNELIQVIPPRGFTKFVILEHSESMFWIMNWNHEIALCEAKS